MDLSDRVANWMHRCAGSTQIQDLRDALKVGERSMQVAESAGEFTRQRQGVAGVFGKARDAFGKVEEGLGKAEGLCLDAQAVARVQRAIGVLRQPNIMSQNPDAAADAFGELFMGFGRLARLLPFPANQYASLLEECGKQNFFRKMKNLMDPEVIYRKQFDGLYRSPGEPPY